MAANEEPPFPPLIILLPSRGQLKVESWHSQTPPAPASLISKDRKRDQSRYLRSECWFMSQKNDQAKGRGIKLPSPNATDSHVRKPCRMCVCLGAEIVENTRSGWERAERNDRE